MIILYIATIVITILLIINAGIVIAKKEDELNIINYKEQRPYWYNMYCTCLTTIIIAIPIVNIATGLILNTDYFINDYIRKQKWIHPYK